MPAPTSQSLLAAVDDQIYRWFRSKLRERHHAERLIIAVTRAQHGWAIAGLLALTADRDRRAAWTRANAILGAAWAAAKLTSRTVKRPRPNLTDCRPARHKTDRQSFPSTHVTIASAAAIALPPLLPRTPLILLATATAISRLLLGEHYPSDVAAGALLGTAIAAPHARLRSGRGVV
jgi:membrane-associated phospholipid phosphatase